MDEIIYNNQGGQAMGAPEGGNKKLLIIILVVVFILILGALAYWFLGRGETPAINNANPNNNLSTNVNANIDQAELVKQKEAEEKSKALGRMFLEPASAEVLNGKEFTVAIMMNTGGYNINAAGAELVFDSKKLEAVKIDANGTVLTIAATKSIEEGRVSIVQGQPADGQWKDNDDGFSGERGLLAKVTFRAKAAGNTEISFNKEESKLIFDDGKGTELKLEYGEGKYIIK